MAKKAKITAANIMKAMGLEDEKKTVLACGMNEDTVEISVKPRLSLPERANMIQDILSMLFITSPDGAVIYHPEFKRFAFEYEIVNYFTDISLPVNSDKAWEFLERTGIADFFINIANAMVGRFSGGPAKVAVVASAFEGMVSGSSVANTVGSGAVTIPLMKRTGYKPEFAAAAEASASTGGQIMPPIMGAAAFLMAETVGVPYSNIVVRAILPAILYFAGVFIAVHLEAKKEGVLEMQDFLNAVTLLPKDVENLLLLISNDFKPKVNEIRFRANKPITLNTKDGVFYCTKTGRVTVNYNDDLYFTDERKLQEVVFSLSRRSIHTYQDMFSPTLLNASSFGQNHSPTG